MEKQVLLIGRSVGFMMNAIINGLKKEDYEVQEVIAGINEVSRVTDLPKLIVLYLDADLASDTEFLVYLKDLVSERERSLFVVGTDDEMEEMEKTLPAEIVVDRLSRPLNVKDLAGRLDAEVARGTAAEARKKILIIDDDPTMLRMIKNLLSDKYHVYMANSGMNGITFLANNKVDLILLDYEMPIANGPQVLSMLKSDSETVQIPVMFLTGHGDKDRVLSIVGLNPADYLLKTIDKRTLLKKLNDFFEKTK
jgi:response regulator RpfG family c-di-GMP phosphodiesterase